MEEPDTRLKLVGMLVWAVVSGLAEGLCNLCYVRLRRKPKSRPRYDDWDLLELDQVGASSILRNPTASSSDLDRRIGGRLANTRLP